MKKTRTWGQLKYDLAMPQAGDKEDRHASIRGIQSIHGTFPEMPHSKSKRSRCWRAFRLKLDERKEKGTIRE